MPNCAHGFPEGECLICRTLGTGPERAKGKPTKTKAAPGADLEALLATTRSAPVVAVRDDSRAGRGDNDRSPRRRPFWPVVAALAVGVVVVWAFAGIFLLALHIAEYVALAGVAGWIGYRIGRAQGRRSPKADN